jgi:hypothetical protein
MGTRLFRRAKKPERGFDHPPPSMLRLRKSRAIPLLALWVLVACSRANFTFTVKCYNHVPSVTDGYEALVGTGPAKDKK